MSKILNKRKLNQTSESDTTESEVARPIKLTKSDLRFRGNLKRSSSKDLKRKIETKPKTFMDDDPSEVAAMTRSMPLPIVAKKSDYRIRILWTIMMLAGFLLLIFAGHLYCAMLIVVISLASVQEILSLKRDLGVETKVGLSYALSWYFTFVISFFFYGKVILNQLSKSVSKSPFILFFYQYFLFITFMLWVAGFLFFVLTLKKGFYRYQFKQFGWTHISTVLIIGQTAAIISNLFEGLIWLLLPSLLVVGNDIASYVSGVCFGKTPLIQLSPKKTWEGFIGGFVSTVIFSFLLSYILMSSQDFICPQKELVFIPFKWVTCTPSNLYEPSYYSLEGFGLPDMKIPIAEVQIHAFVISLFVSLISPFGGFFASGFKNAIKVKDFGGMIPGHGGMTDRMDCQIITGTFSYIYIQQFVLGKMNYISGVTRYIVSEMTAVDQLAVYHLLNSQLKAQGLLNATALN